MQHRCKVKNIVAFVTKQGQCTDGSRFSFRFFGIVFSIVHDKLKRLIFFFLQNVTFVSVVSLTDEDVVFSSE